MDLTLSLNLISTFAVVGALVFAGWQLRLSARQRTTEASLHLLQALRSLDFVEGVIALADQPEGLTRAELEKHMGAKWDKAMLVLTNLDGLGLMVYRREIDAELADDFFKHSVAVTWRALKTMIGEARRDIVHSELVYEWLQWLAEEQAARHRVDRLPAYRQK